MQVGSKSSAAIQLDTGTVQGSALSHFLFDLFIKALLRLLDSTGISHRVRGVPDWNHQAFADDLSLYVSSTEDANTLLDIVSTFQEWSSLNLLKNPWLQSPSMAEVRPKDRRRRQQNPANERPQRCHSTLSRQSYKKLKISKICHATLLTILNLMTKTWLRPVTISSDEVPSRGVRLAAETVVPTTSSPNPKVNALNVSSPGYPRAFDIKAMNTTRSTGKLPSGS